MKQDEIKIGESYLFGRTDRQEKKFMQNTIVTVIGKKKGSKKSKLHSGIVPYAGRSQMRFKLSNNYWCNASNLNPISTTKSNQNKH